MKQLNLVVPGLLGPFANEMPAHILQCLNQPEFNEINKVLSRAESQDICAASYYETLVHLIHPQLDMSLCQLTAEYDGLDTSDGYFYRADPVYFKAESDHAILLGAELISPDEDEIRQLIDCFNQHFAEDKLSLHSSSPDRWYLRSEKPLQLTFTALDDALGRDIKHFLPTGDDALWWRKILNEAQMLFFQHAVNQTRESAGQLTINGLWLWDATSEAAPLGSPTVDQVFANEIMAVALAKQKEITAKSTDIIEIKSTAVLVLDSIYESVCYGDVDAWSEALSVFCSGDFQRVMALLSAKSVDEVNIYPCNGKVYCLNRMTLLKFWKARNNINNYLSIL